MSITEESAGATAIRPFTIKIPQAEIEALRARIAATRWPSRELVDDRSQGVQLATIRELARYWAADYDWRACEARLKREVAARRRAAADHDARLARLGDRAARGRGPADPASSANVRLPRVHRP